jgi:hypothetical protein
MQKVTSAVAHSVKYTHYPPIVMVTGLWAWLLLYPSDAAAAEAGPAEDGNLVAAAAGD